MPHLRSKEDLVTHDGQLVNIVGTYQAVDTHPHPYPRRGPDGKITMTYVIARLELEDRTLVMVGVRPEQELAELDGKKVVAIGRLEASPPLVPGMAQLLPMPTLRTVESVTLWSE